jgi:hypothetical protein
MKFGPEVMDVIRQQEAVLQAVILTSDILRDNNRAYLATALLSVAADTLVSMSPEHDDGALIETVQQSLADILKVKRQNLNKLIIQRWGEVEGRRRIAQGPKL